MKKSEIVLLWVAGLWSVLCFVLIANGLNWGQGVAGIFAGWIVCGLVCVSLRKWPKRSADTPSTAEPAPSGRLGIVVACLGYVLALVFLLAWTNARAQIDKERLAVEKIATGYFELSDCHALSAPQAGRCVAGLLRFTPVSREEVPGDPWEQALKEVTQRCFFGQAILTPEPTLPSVQPIK